MNLCILPSLNFNRNNRLTPQKQNSSHLQSGAEYSFNINCYPKSYYCNQISFGKKVSANDTIKTIGEDNFPSPVIVEKLKNVGNSNDFSLRDIHTEHYKELLELSTLDEIKEKYPEFSDVVDAKDIDVNSLNKQTVLYRIHQHKIKGIDTNNLTVEILKRMYGKLLPLENVENYWGISRGGMSGVTDLLHIKILNNDYARIIACDSDKARQKKSVASKKAWADPKLRQKQSEASKATWADPKSVYNSDEYRQKISEASKATWADPKYRRKMSETKKATWADPKLRQKKSEAMKAAWANPNSGFYSDEYKNKMEMVYKSSKAAYERHPEITSMMQEVAKSFPRLPEIIKKIHNNIELTDEEKAIYNAYYKKCHETMPEYQKIIGEEQKKILEEWGFYENE